MFDNPFQVRMLSLLVTCGVHIHYVQRERRIIQNPGIEASC